MPYLIYPGVYAYTEDYNTEVVVNYQLSYLVDSALLSIDRVLGEYPQNHSYLNKIQYYRFYVDHLMMCLGRINDYLVPKGNATDFINLNRNLYNFTDDTFPIISEKKPRNLVEHLSERNNITIKNYGSVGGFNVLFLDSDKELKDSVTNKKEYYPYTLDLENNSIVFSDNRNRSDGSIENYSIDLLLLRKELNELKQRIAVLESHHKS